jgi:hypothetical protein
MDGDHPLVQQGLAIMRQLMRTARRHRVDLFEKGLRPLLKRDRFGNVRLDWSDYDAVVRPYLTGSAFEDRLGCRAWPVPFSQDWPKPGLYGGIDSLRYFATAREVLRQCRQHFAELHVQDRVFLWPWRGPVAADAFAQQMSLSRIARAGDRETPVLSRLPAQLPPQSGWNVPAGYRAEADILAPPAQWVDPTQAAAARRADRPLAGLWLAPGAPPYLPGLSALGTAVDARAVPWFAYKYGFSGLLLPEVLNWPDTATEAAPEPEGALFYAGSIVAAEGVLPSVRLKRLRRGLQDVACLSLLESRGAGGVARLMAHALVRYAGLAAAADNYLDPRLNGWVRDPAIWRKARRLLYEETQGVVRPSVSSARQSFAQRLQWRQINQEARTVRLERIRTRLLPPAPSCTGVPPSEALQACVLLDLHNEHLRGRDMEASFDRLPAGWKPLGPCRFRLAAGQRQVVELCASCGFVPASRNGKHAATVAIETTPRKRRLVDADFHFLLAGKAAQAVKIDGVLDDWPLRAGNAAADFRLIGRRGSIGTGLAGRQTVAFVLHDRRNLYIALRCAEPEIGLLRARSDNVFRCEQLLLRDEDLIEVVLDPGADASGTDDLYHIAVKANGITRARRGVRTDPPLAQSRPWAVDASVAVAAQKDVWIVEMAIPLEAFGPEGQSAFWAINFARFAPQGLEASSWTGARRHFYDPRSLGTMVLASPQADESSPSGNR